MPEHYNNDYIEHKIKARTMRTTPRQDRDKRCLNTAHAFITRKCLEAGKILHEDVLFLMYMDIGLERVLLPRVFSRLYHSMIPNLIKAVNAAKGNL